MLRSKVCLDGAAHTTCPKRCFVQAQTYAARAAQLQPNSQQALLTLIYVELCKGNSVMALTLLKQQQLPTN